MTQPSRPAVAAPAADPRILTESECAAVFQRLTGFAQDAAQLVPELVSWWTGELRWGRNRVTLASDRRDVRLRLGHRGAKGWYDRPVITNQVDAASLQAAVRILEGSDWGDVADQAATLPAGTPVFASPASLLPMPQPAIWSEATATQTPETRGAVARALVEAAEAQGLLAAGYLEVRVGSRCWLANGERHYVPFTQAQCSMTVRDTKGTASGWAGGSSYDWGTLDPPALAQRALEKCVASRNPVALEPGRYTVILEPQAVADLLEVLVHSFGRWQNEKPGMGGIFTFGPFQSKLGLKVVDERLTLSHDPLDPALGILPDPGTKPVTWIDRGVLTNLFHNRQYSQIYLNENLPVRSPEFSYRLSGGTTSVEEMIATTRRGLLVTRFSGLGRLPGELLTGLTRDGLWLIEQGKLTKPVKNLRFVESPLFVLNQVEQLGVPVPVFRPTEVTDFEEMRYMWTQRAKQVARRRMQDAFVIPLSRAVTPAIVPPMKVRDFSFTALVDAV